MYEWSVMIKQMTDLTDEPTLDKKRSFDGQRLMLACVIHAQRRSLGRAQYRFAYASEIYP